jgi:predicted 2-oxoglutarate/Fe(II)-dependent dioxygenase YbiX
MAGASVERLLPGDRIPDVRLHAESGYSRTLHAHFAGTPLWLARPSLAEAAATLPQVPAGVTAICVAEVLYASVPDGWLALRADTRWLDLIEPDQLWRADANLRLQAAYPLHEARGLPVALAADLAASTRGAAPVLQIPDVFEPDLCKAIIRHLEVDCEGGELSRVLVMEGSEQVLQLDPSIKRRRESLPRDKGLEDRMHERLMRRALPEIARVFNFTANRRDALKLLAYPEGAGYFHAHRDNDTPDVAHRRFALSINLNHGEYQGGDFRFPEFGPHLYAPATGTALVFSCSLLHEVLPVQSGTRYAMTTFLY